VRLRGGSTAAPSCKGRRFRTSCGGWRMTERAAHLVDHVFPDVPVRQWVLSLPPKIRYLLEGGTRSRGRGDAPRIDAPVPLAAPAAV
jgi:hypothetical protein